MSTSWNMQFTVDALSYGKIFSQDNCTSHNSVNKFQQYAVGAATSRPKHSETEQLVERIPPDGSPKSLLLLEKVPPAGGGCGGDTYNKCQSG